MGLFTDIFFIQAIKSNDALMERLPAHDVYNNIAYPDIDMDNVPIPYIIVNNDGGSNAEFTKDDNYEGKADQVNISVRIVEKNRAALGKTALEVRRTIRDYMRHVDELTAEGNPPENAELKPNEYQFSWGEVAFDTQKPSVTVILNYQCDTINELYLNDEQE